MGATVEPRTLRRVPRLGSAEWLALQAGLPARLWNDPALRRYARRRRRVSRLVIVGAVVAAVIWDLIAVARGAPVTAIGWPLALVIGAFAGRIIPELVGSNRSAGPVRVAVLSSRSPLRFITTSARRWLVGSVALAVAGTVMSRGSGQTLRGDLAPIAVSLGLAVCGSLAVIAIAHRSQRRRRDR